MILSSSSTHALRAVAWIAANARGELVPGRDLARRIGVPSDYLAKVMGRLQRTGVVTATRGARGGYRLARPAPRIRLVDVVAPFEGARARPGCLLHPRRSCPRSRPCSAHDAWAEVKATYTRFLEKTTVADIQPARSAERGGRP